MPRRNLLPGSAVTANTLRLSGITMPVGIAVSPGAEVSVDGSAFGPGPTVAERGQPIIVRATAPAAGAAAVVELVTGTVTTSWPLHSTEAVGFTHQVLYGPWGACDASAPCMGMGSQSRDTLCLRSDGRFVPVGECGGALAAVETRGCPSPAGQAACTQPPLGSVGWTQNCAAGSDVRAACAGTSCAAGYDLVGGTCVAQDVCAGTPAVGDRCADGSVYIGTLTFPADAGAPTGSQRVFAAACDLGRSWNGTACVGVWDITQWENGSVFRGDLDLDGAGPNTAASDNIAANTSAFLGDLKGKARSDAQATLPGVPASGGPLQAAQKCAALGAGWYLPGGAELELIWQAAYQGPAVSGSGSRSNLTAFGQTFHRLVATNTAMGSCTATPGLAAEVDEVTPPFNTPAGCPAVLWGSAEVSSANALVGNLMNGRLETAGFNSMSQSKGQRYAVRCVRRG